MGEGLDGLLVECHGAHVSHGQRELDWSSIVSDFGSVDSKHMKRTRRDITCKDGNETVSIRLKEYKLPTACDAGVCPGEFRKRMSTPPSRDTALATAALRGNARACARRVSVIHESRRALREFRTMYCGEAHFALC